MCQACGVDTVQIMRPPHGKMHTKHPRRLQRRHPNQGWRYYGGTVRVLLDSAFTESGALSQEEQTPGRTGPVMRSAVGAVTSRRTWSWPAEGAAGLRVWLAGPAMARVSFGLCRHWHSPGAGRVTEPLSVHVVYRCSLDCPQIEEYSSVSGQTADAAALAYPALSAAG
jgi:hypothetical protein